MVFYHNINPILFDIWPLQVRWYGLMYVLSFLFVYWFVRKCSREGKLKLSEEQIDNFMIWQAIALIAGARLFDFIFWDWQVFASNPLKIFAIWEGGLSFHGGLFGIIIATILLCKKYNVKFLDVADVFVIPLALGQAFGRIGNFINGELYGFPTTLSWGVNFGNELDVLGNPVFRHPVQLYEVLYDLVIFTTLWFIKDKNLPRGYFLGIFLIMYSIFRTLTEFVRVQDVMWGSLSVGQALNIPVFVAGIFLLVKMRRKNG